LRYKKPEITNDNADLLLSKLIAAAGWLTRAYNKHQEGAKDKEEIALKATNAAIDQAIEILRG